MIVVPGIVVAWHHQAASRPDGRGNSTDSEIDHGGIAVRQPTKQDRHATRDETLQSSVALRPTPDLRKGHTGADVLRFFKQIDATVPRDLGVHVILDNLSARSTPEIAKWLALLLRAAGHSRQY